MSIGAIGAAQGHVKPEMPTTKELTSEPVSAGHQTTPTTAKSAQATAADSQKGVIRNLLAGHFKGVADVRLRMNFHEELARIEQDARAASIEGQPDAFTSIARDGLDSVCADTDGTAGTAILADYKESVRTAFEEFGAELTVSSETLSGSLRAAFSAFIGSLEEALSAPVEPGDDMGDTGVTRAPEAATAQATGAERPADKPYETAITGPDTGDGFDLARFITDLTVAFEAALADLELALQSASVLPGLSEPHGNGVAFERFLTVYEAMHTGSAAQIPSSNLIEAEA